MDELAKLTVPQLKALCKERKLVGYSRLNKTALLQKLLGNSSSIAAQPSTVAPKPTASESWDKPTSGNEQNLKSPQVTATKTDFTATARNINENRSATATSGTSLIEIETSTSAHRQPPQGQGVAANPLQPPVPNSGSSTSQSNISGSGPTPVSLQVGSSLQPLPPKRGLEDAPSYSGAKRPRQASSDSPGINSDNAGVPFPRQGSLQMRPIAGRLPDSTNMQAPGPGRLRLELEAARREVSSGFSMEPSAPQTMVKKRFAPLMPKPSQPLPLPSNFETKETLGSGKSKLQAPPVNWRCDELVQGSHLEFLSNTPPILRPITMPPSIAQRRKLQKLSLVFSLLDINDLKVLGKLCRLYRYSAYVAASHIVRREFPGKRLQVIMDKYAPNMFNFWPYLLQRKKEKKARQEFYKKSFLGRALREHPSIFSADLWSSPDHGKQTTIAIRFLMTLFYFHISVGFDPHGTFKAQPVISIEEIIPHEIWRVGVKGGDAEVQYYYVLESTCEAVGLSECAPKTTRAAPGTDQQTLLMRADWTAYIDSRLQSLDGNLGILPKCLVDFLQWPNHEEYDRGISKLWLSRIETEGRMGGYKRTVAERYVMACVVGNSISGRAMSCTEMAHEFNGTPMASVHQKLSNVHLYLPAHHFVESVHFNTSKGLELHPALAAVQTPSREYYILKDNGMQVGCEEDGVSFVWMELLRCDRDGVPTM